MERRFRASIYVDVWVDATDNLENDRLTAEEMVKNFQKEIPNSYIGGVAKYDMSYTNSLDKEI